MVTRAELEAHSKYEHERQKIISENRSRRMRKVALPPLPVPAKRERPFGFLVDTKAGNYLGFFRSQDLAEVQKRVAEYHDPEDCTYTKQAIM